MLANFEYILATVKFFSRERIASPNDSAAKRDAARSAPGGHDSTTLPRRLRSRAAAQRLQRLGHVVSRETVQPEGGSEPTTGSDSVAFRKLTPLSQSSHV
jgi:hypothetical protein